MKTIKDQLNNTLQLTATPQRVISVVPSITELLYDLDVDVVGVTTFCVHPNEWYKNKPRIGGTKKLNVTKILELKPDLILANKEENTKGDIKYLAQHVPVFGTDIPTVEAAYDMIDRVGLLLDRQKEANQLQSELKALQSAIPIRSPRRCLYLIWRDPFMTIGGDTFIHSTLHVAGFQNVSSDQIRYPELTVEKIKQLNPEIILLSSEPYPFKEKHISELKEILPQAKIQLVDGELYSWYGSRMKAAFQHFQEFNY